MVGNFVGSIETIFGGNITTYTELCEHARRKAYEVMMQHADEIGDNEIIGIHYDANQVMEGVTEVLAYGPAVVIE